MVSQVNGLPPHEPVELTFEPDYIGKRVEDSTQVAVRHLQLLIEQIESRKIDAGSLLMNVLQGMYPITDNNKIKRYHPTGEFTLFLHFRWEDSDD